MRTVCATLTIVIEMGFDAQRVDWALHAAPGGLEQALNHLEEHQDEPVPNWRAQDASAAAASIKCNDCGKFFRNMDLAMYHAEKSGHEAFEESSEEIKPLTPEEREARLAECECRADQCAQKWRASEQQRVWKTPSCLLYTSDAADE